MDKYSPEFSAYWQSDTAAAPGDHSETSAQALSTAQELALEELVERVSAARSIV